MMLALVDAKTALDFLLVAIVCVVLLYGWVKLDRREKSRRLRRKERQAYYTREVLRTQREWDEAQRYHGIGVGR